MLLEQSVLIGIGRKVYFLGVELLQVSSSSKGGRMYNVPLPFAVCVRLISCPAVCWRSGCMCARMECGQKEHSFVDRLGPVLWRQWRELESMTETVREDRWCRMWRVCTADLMLRIRC